MEYFKIFLTVSVFFFRLSFYVLSSTFILSPFSPHPLFSSLFFINFLLFSTPLFELCLTSLLLSAHLCFSALFLRFHFYSLLSSSIFSKLLIVSLSFFLLLYILCPSCFHLLSFCFLFVFTMLWYFFFSSHLIQQSLMDHYCHFTSSPFSDAPFDFQSFCSAIFTFFYFSFLFLYFSLLFFQVIFIFLTFSYPSLFLFPLLSLTFSLCFYLLFSLSNVFSFPFMSHLFSRSPSISSHRSSIFSPLLFILSFICLNFLFSSSFRTRESLASNTSSIVESNRRQNPALSPGHMGSSLISTPFSFRSVAEAPSTQAEKLQKPNNCLASITSVWPGSRRNTQKKKKHA